MKRNSNNVNIVTILMYVIIIIVILSVFFLVYISNNNLLNNKANVENNNTKKEETSKTSANDEEDNNIQNQDKGKINQTEDPNQEAKINEEKSQIDNENKSTPKQQEETQIATYTTTLYDKEKTRIENINLAISKLNGVTIENGSEFSFNNTIGPMDESNGFKKATGFDSNGKKIKISGGGICQISSTLYNSALIANFNITERYPHSRRVYYVPKDKDATIYYGSLDLKFINNSGGKVRIDASATNTTVTITLVKIT